MYPIKVMYMDEVDAELEAIRQKKLMELMSGGKKESVPDAISGPITVTDANFDASLKEHHLVLVDAWAPWCQPCRMVAPILDEVAHELKGQVVIAKLNVDENPRIAGRYNIMSIPTIMLFKDGVMVAKSIGVRPKQQILAMCQKFL